MKRWLDKGRQKFRDRDSAAERRFIDDSAKGEVESQRRTEDEHKRQKDESMIR